MIEFFGGIDWLAVLKIIGIDIMLGGDNAILIALAVAGLTPQLQNKAIAWGTAGAIGARIVLLAAASFLLMIPFVKVGAGLFLVWIGYSLLVGGDDDEVDQKTAFWPAVWTIVVADIMMSIDNVVAVIGAAQSTGEHALYYAIAGIALSIPIIIYASKLVVALMEKFPIVTWLGAMLLGWIGLEMVATDTNLATYVTDLHSYALFFGAVGATIVGVAGYLKTRIFA